VRYLTSTSGDITDTYTYDAYGNLMASSGSTANNYLYCGEQYDPQLKFYYNRARYLNPDTGRFWTMDTFAGNNEDPLSLHKYRYVADNPVTGLDPSGHEDIGGMMMAMDISASLDAIPGILTTPMQVISHGGAIYPVVVVTLPNGTQYMPETKVKNNAQAVRAGVPINTAIYISVPAEVDPQDLVEYWTEEKKLGPLRDNFANFLDFWRPGGSHDFKLLNPLFDAFGNFGFGATGYSAGFSLRGLQFAADEAHGFLNNPINSADILSGFNATSKGGKLSAKTTNLVPSLPVPFP
jgi:RHS repeat-associated protein